MSLSVPGQWKQDLEFCLSNKTSGGRRFGERAQWLRVLVTLGVWPHL